MASDELLQIDVRGLIAAKSPKLLKRIPGFVIRYLERIVHQEEINDFLRRNPEKKDLVFMREVLREMEISVEVDGYENVPEEGRFVFAANHPLGGLEALVLMLTVSEKHPDFLFVVNDILMALKPMNGLFVPVNKHGSQSRESVKRINEVYQSDTQVLFFPAGLVSRKTKGKVVDLPWQKAFVSKAIDSRRDIIPVFIDGKNSKRFYRIAKFRKIFRIKINIEMLFLADELFKYRGKTIKITYGKPVSYKFFDKSKSNKEWAAYLKEKVYSLK